MSSAIAFRLLVRERGALSLLLLTLVVTTAALVALFRLEGRIEGVLLKEHAQLLGADLVVSASHPLPRAWLARARDLGLKTAEKVTLATMILAGDQMALAGLEAVTENFPLRGSYTLRADREVRKRAAPPERGAIWLSRRLQAALGFPKTVRVGRQRLRVSGEVLWSPAAEWVLQQFLPRAIVRLEDLRKSGVLGPGTQAVYSQLFAGEPHRLDRFRRWLASQSPQDVRLFSQPEPLRRTFERSRALLAVLKLLLVVMAAGILALTARTYVRNNHLLETIAVLRSLGASRRQIAALLSSMVLLIALSTIPVGTLLGLLLESAAQSMLPLPPAPGASWSSLLEAALIVLALLFGLVWPRFLSLRKLTPWRVLRGSERERMPFSAHVEFALLAALLLLIATREGAWRSALLLLGALLLLFLLSYALLALTVGLLRGAAGRLTARRLLGTPFVSSGQIVALTVVLGALGAADLLRAHLVEEWRRRIPEQAPNHFVINLFPDELSRFRRRLEVLGARLEPFFPLVRGRLVAVGGEPVERRVRPGTVGEVALRRDLNLTWSRELPRYNRIVAGRWWSGKTESPEISVEKRFAEGLGLSLGETVTWIIEGETVSARVTSIREVEWTALTPNFFVIFSPGGLERFAATYMTSFYLPPGQEIELVKIARDFPHVTFLEVRPLVEAFRMALDRMTGAFQLFLLAMLVLGVAAVAAAVGYLLQERREEVLLLKALGASRGMVVRALLLEFVVLGSLAACLAIGFAEGVYLWISWRWFHLWPTFHAELLGLVPLAVFGMVVIASASLWRLYRRSPVDVLR